MNSKILIVSVCRESLHELEFVKPIEDIVKKEKGFVRHYKDLKEKELKKAEKIIICGTSLKDNAFLSDIERFKWIKDCDKPILGICAGMQIIGLVFGNKSLLKKKTEIGFYFETFRKNFLGLKGREEVYHLHNYYVDFSKLLELEDFVKGKISKAVKHKEKPIYGVLFHPEVRQKETIMNFVKEG